MRGAGVSAEEGRGRERWLSLPLFLFWWCRAKCWTHITASPRRVGHSVRWCGGTAGRGGAGL